MKKITLLVLIVILSFCLVSCDDWILEGLNPPRFYHGVWVCADMPVYAYEFTKDDLILCIGHQRASLKETYLDDPYVYLSDSYDDGEYTIKLEYYDVDVDFDPTTRYVFKIIDWNEILITSLWGDEVTSELLFIRQVF